MELTGLVICIVLGFSGFFLRFFLLPAGRLPPSPWGLPLLGHLHLLGTMPHRSLQMMSKKFGDLMFLRFGMVPAIVVSSPEIAKEVFKTHDVTFSSRPYLVVGEIMAYNFKGVVLSSGDQWKNMRRICTTELFTAKRMESFSELQLAEVSDAVLYLSKSEQGVVNAREIITRISFNIMTQILMSKRFFGEHVSESDMAEAKVFKEVMEEGVQFTLQFHISEFLPQWLRWIDWSRFQAQELKAKQDSFLHKLFETRKASNRMSSTTDFLDTLLQRTDDEEVVKATIMETLAAGSDTGACALEWALLELLNNPNVMTKLQAELDAVVEPNHMVTENDFPKLPYLGAVVKETLRLHSPAPMLVPRMSTQDCILAGYNVPRGATTIINYYSIARDPRFWEKPTEFWPERFGASTLDFRGQDFQYIPFGAGRRICPGMAIGLKTIYLTLGNFLHCFNWHCIPGRSYEPEETFGVVSWLKTPLEAQLTRRC